MQLINLKRLIIVNLISWSVLSPTLAQTETTTQPIQTQTTHTQPTQSFKAEFTDQQITGQAKIWHLTTKEYKHYLNLMKNSPAGIWYKNLDPAEILGLSADNSHARQKYALIEAHLDLTRIPHELAYQKAFSQAVKTLLPNIKPMKWHSKIEQQLASHRGYLHAIHQLNVETHQPFSNNAQLMLQSGDQLLLFVQLNDSLSNQVTLRLIKLIQMHPNIKLNIFFVGKNIFNKKIFAWAKQNHIEQKLVKQGVITLNRNNERFKKYYPNKADLPKITLDRQGQFKTISITSVL